MRLEACQVNAVAIPLFVALLLPGGASRGTAQRLETDSFAVYEQPTSKVSVRSGATLALYCSGRGHPTVFLESGSGGGTYQSWYRLQPLIARRTRVCSYDRAGFGFSQLGADLPRDLDHILADLHDLLHRSGEAGPFVLVGHSMGGQIVGAYGDKYSGDVAGLVLLEPAVIFSVAETARSDATDGKQLAGLKRQLQTYGRCAARMAAAPGRAHAAAGDPCLDSRDFDRLSPAMAKIEIEHESTPEFWRALTSELENNWLGTNSREAAALLPHRWHSLPIRVVTAAISELSDSALAAATAIRENDRPALAAARTNHARWEQRQARVCDLSTDCHVTRVHTADHFVQNAVPKQVAQIIATLVDELTAAPPPSSPSRPRRTSGVRPAPPE